MKKRQRIRWILMFLVFIIFDQTLKFYFQYKNFMIIPKVFFIKYSENLGLIFGFFSNIWFFTFLLPILVLSVLIYYFIKEKNKLFKKSIFLIIIGVSGNLIGRIILGYVIDFFYIPIYPALNMTNFNLSDVAILSGVIISIISLQKSRPKK